MTDLEKFQTMPKDWRFDKTFGSPVAGYAPICDGISILKGGKKGLLKIKKQVPPKIYQPVKSISPKKKNAVITAEQKKITVKLINDLARLKVKELILKDLIFDLMVCKIEGWCAKQYVSDLKTLIDDTANSILRSDSKGGSDD